MAAVMDCGYAELSCHHFEHLVLVLSRKPVERSLIGDQIAITVVKIGHGGVRIGVEAPAELAVVREELATKLNNAERQAVKDASRSVTG